MSNEPQTIHDIPRLKEALKKGRWFMNHYDVQELLGKNRNGGHLPDEGFEIVHNGVTIKCDPKEKRPNDRKTLVRRPKSSKHRVHYFCACCKWIPLGRAHQHLPKCEATDATI